MSSDLLVFLAKQEKYTELLAALQQQPRLPTATANRLFLIIVRSLRRAMNDTTTRMIQNIIHLLTRKYGVDLHQENELLFRRSVRNNLTYLIRFCIQNHAQVEVNDNEILIFTVTHQRIPFLKFLLTMPGIDVNARNNLPLQIAVKQNNHIIMQLLLDAGANDQPVIDHFQLSREEKKAYADFFIVFCSSVHGAASASKEEEGRQLHLMKGALLQSQIYTVTSDDTEFITNADAKQLCNWMKVQLYALQSSCTNPIDVTTGKSITRIPLVYLYTLAHPVTGKRMCFDLFDFYQRMQRLRKLGIQEIPIPVDQQELGLQGGAVEYFFTPQQIMEVEKVFRARMKLFWRLRSHLSV